MPEVNLWKLAERIEGMMDNLEDINDYLDQVHETNVSFNMWIQAATESLLDLQKQVKFLNSKKTPL